MLLFGGRRCQPLSHRVAALWHTRLQPPSHTVAAAATPATRGCRPLPHASRDDSWQTLSDAWFLDYPYPYPYP